MSAGYAYMDSSALVKLGVDEAESIALREWLAGRDLVASEIADVEVERTIRRVVDPKRFDEALATALDGVFFYTLDPLLRREAGRLQPAAIRSPDAIHIATALRLAPELEAVITYDMRMAQAAERAGLPVRSPGLD